MTDPSRVEDLLHAALERPPHDRPAFLDRACAGDASLRREVERLLAAVPAIGDFLERPPAVPSEATRTLDGPGTDTTGFVPIPRDTADPSLAGTVLAGRYRLIELLGEGGMGTVWLAEQTEPVKRPVAVKLIKPGMDSARVVARFEAERQALAVMDHPNIARVLDGGTTPGGRPFFVMEVVRGEPITDYCDGHRLTVRQRLDLFVPVCQAVQHAHQKGVMHRDLKPTNVLVAEVDGRPVPKVIDFGLAKALFAGAIADASLDTMSGSVLGTPLYMAPEQADPAADVDTRADVYALGIMLYELLTGSTPLDRDTLRKAVLAEALRQVREVPAPSPTQRLRLSGSAASVAAVRGTDPAHLAREVRGDLEWIALKCLEKDRGRRYDTPVGLAADLLKHLANEPVSAGPPSRWYRARKFVRRNRVPVLVGSVLALGLVLGVVGTTWGLVRARRAAADMEQAAIETGRAAARTSAVNDFLLHDLLGQADLEENPEGATLTVRQAFDRAAAALAGSDTVKQYPELEPELRAMFGNGYRTLGQYAESERQLRLAIEQARHFYGDEDELTLNCQSDLGRTLLAMGRDGDAEEILRQTYNTRVHASGPEHKKTLAVEDNLANALFELGRTPEAVALIRHNQEATRRTAGEGSKDAITAECNLAYMLTMLQTKEGDVEATEIYRRRYPEVQKLLTADHPSVLTIGGNFGQLLSHQRLYAEALPLCEDILGRRLRLQGPDHLGTLVARSNRALILLEVRRVWEAVGELREIYDRDKAAAQPFRVQGSANALGLALQRLGQFEEAEKLFREGLAIARDRKTQAQPSSIQNLLNLGRLLLERRDYEGARSTFVQVLELDQIALGNTDRDPRIVLQLGIAEEKVRRYTDAEKSAKHVMETWEGGVGGLEGRALLGASLLGQGKLPAAQAELLHAYRDLPAAAAKRPTYQRRIPNADLLGWLAQLYRTTNRPTEAALYEAERAKIPPPVEYGPPPREAKS